MCVVCMYAHMCVWERLLAHVGACRGQRLTSGFLLCCSLPWLFFEILKGFFLKKIPCMCACLGNVPVNISARRVQKRILGPLEQQSQMVLSQWCGCRALNLCPLEEQTSALEPWASLHPLLFVLLRETLTEPGVLISRAGWPSGSWYTCSSGACAGSWWREKLRHCSVPIRVSETRPQGAWRIKT